MPSTADSRYEESVPAPRWVQLALLLAAAGAGVAALAAATSESGRPSERAILVVALLAVAALLAVVAVVFTTLHISVTKSQVRFGFGPFATVLGSDDVTSVGVERYPWWRFGGWGLRRAIGHWGERAYTVPFARDAVALEASGGRRFHVSSRDPERFAAALGTLVGPSPAAGSST